MKDNEELVRSFLKQSRQEIADDGFTRRVMEALPKQQGESTFDWSLFFAITLASAVVLFVYLGGLEATRSSLETIAANATQGFSLSSLFSHTLLNSSTLLQESISTLQGVSLWECLLCIAFFWYIIGKEIYLRLS